MKSMLLVFSLLFVALHAAVVNRNLPQILETPTETPPCSTNASSAYVDIILLIDTSANMGNVNLRKISTTLSLVLPKFTIGQQVDITQGFRNTRIAVITFDLKGTIVANYTDINSVNDLANVLNGLSASNSQEADLFDGLAKALSLQESCSGLNCSSLRPNNYKRPTAMIVFAAAANSAVEGYDSSIIKELDNMDDGTVITVNFNPANQDLNDLFWTVTYVPSINATMYNFMGTSNTLTKDLEWAILQANCYCGDVSSNDTAIPSSNIIAYDQANSRYSKYAECTFLAGYGTPYPSDTIGACAIEPLQVIPAFILTKQRELFFQNSLPAGYLFYFGLHQNNQSQWSFYNYDKTEFPVSSYTNWAPGYPNGTDRCAIVYVNDDGNGITSVWKNSECNIKESGLDLVVCQGKSCDASSVACCANCTSNGVSYEKKQKIRTKHHNIKHMKLINGKPVRTA